MKEYPKTKNGNGAMVIVTLKNGCKLKAMFYWNGKEPRFASYGSNITSEVISWEYRKQKGVKNNGKISLNQ